MVAAQSGEMSEQIPEGMDGQAILGRLGPDLLFGPRRPLSRGDDGATAGSARARILIAKQQRGQAPSHVPLHVVGQHAQEHVGSHPVG